MCPHHRSNPLIIACFLLAIARYLLQQVIDTTRTVVMLQSCAAFLSLVFLYLFSCHSSLLPFPTYLQLMLAYIHSSYSSFPTFTIFLLRHRLVLLVVRVWIVCFICNMPVVDHLSTNHRTCANICVYVCCTDSSLASDPPVRRVACVSLHQMADA